MFKKFSIYIFVEKIYEIGYLEGSGVPVLYIGRTVPKGKPVRSSSSLRIQEKKKHMESSRDWLLEQDRFRSDETKRPGKSIRFEDTFGPEVSFRQLSFD
jgi:hypothetical protein